MNRWRAAIRSLFRASADRELDAELRFHIEAQIEENLSIGMTPAEAERKARLQFGGVQQTKEACREARVTAKLEWLFQDLRFGARLLARDPAFAAVAVLTLALGIGVNLAAFNVYNAVALRPLPVRDPDTLVRLTRQSPHASATSVAYPAMEFVARNNTVLAAVMAEAGGRYPVGENLRQHARVQFVSGNYFSELGAGAAYGRLFDAKTDGVPTAEPVAVLSYGFWERQYGADAGAIGKMIRINLKPATIIGVAAYDFNGLQAAGKEVWLLLPQHAYFVEGSRLLSDYAGDGIEMYGRLKTGVSAQTAADQLASVLVALRQEQPKHIWENERLALAPAGRLADPSGMRPEELAVGAVLVSLVLLILVVACTNLGSLLLARAVTREREMSIRRAVGAGRGRIIAQLLSESFLLAILGTAAGMGLGAAALRLFRAQMDMPAQLQFVLDRRMFLFSFGIAVLATLLFGLAPALQAARQGHRSHRARRFLIGVQVAASCVLLIVSGLLVRSLRKALVEPIGFEYENVLVLDAALSSHGFEPAAAAAYGEAIRKRVAALPGVKGVAFTTAPPLGGLAEMMWLRGPVSILVYISPVDAPFFQTMAIPLLRGRNFAAGERNVVIIGETLAQKLWPGQNPLGREFPDGSKAPPVVIGIAGAARTLGLTNGEATEMYRSLSREETPLAAMLVKTAGPPEMLAETVRSLALAVDARAVPTITLMKDSFRQRMRPPRDMALMTTSLGVMAAFLSAMGVFGLVSYAVSQRQKEIGLRMALGANAASVLGLVMRQFVRPLGAGLVAGIVAAAGLSVALRSELFGLSHLDPVSYGGAIVFFVTLTGLAALAPARRALRVDPAMVLRHD